MNHPDESIPFIPDAYSARFARFFGWWARDKIIAKKFHAVRVCMDNRTTLAELNTHPGPVLALTNHIGWWDPLFMLAMHITELPDRTLRAPMDAKQLERFRLFRKLGCFGIDPDEPASLPLMGDYVAEYFKTDPSPTLWVTPQGRFADVREEIRIRPGAAATAARADNPAVICMNFEYAFLVDQKPEAFIRFERVETPEAPSTTGWHRAMQDAIRRNAAELATLVIARDTDAFEKILGSGTKNQPIYDLWLKLRGKGGAIDDRRDRLASRRNSA